MIRVLAALILSNERGHPTSSAHLSPVLHATLEYILWAYLQFSGIVLQTAQIARESGLTTTVEHWISNVGHKSSSDRQLPNSSTSCSVLIASTLPFSTGGQPSHFRLQADYLARVAALSQGDITTSITASASTLTLQPFITLGVQQPE